MTTYAIISWDASLEAAFDQLQSEGVQQTDFSTVRKSLDGKLAVVKWTGGIEEMPDTIASRVVAAYEHPAILTVLNSPAWTCQVPKVLTFYQRHHKKIAAGLIATAAIGSGLTWLFF